MDSDDDADDHKRAMSQEDIHQILRYLELPLAPTLPLPPLDFLAAHVHTLPTPLLRAFSSVTTPRQRTSIREIKSRRMIYASTVPLPSRLGASMGRLRWPLLWERMGGSSLPPPSTNVQEEESWVMEHFPLGAEGRQHVKKLGGFLRGLEEEREWEEMAAAKRKERRLDEVGEEFDEESDEEYGGMIDGGPGSRAVNGHAEQVNQEEVKVAFEKKLLELFIDGMDTISYDDIDFTEPDEGDPIAIRDAEDQYFDEESPSEDGTVATPLSRDGVDINADGMASQNGKGEYDY